MRKIVVGVTGEHGSRHALRWAAQRAFDRRATLEVVTALASPAIVTTSAGAVACIVDQAAALDAAMNLQRRLIESELHDPALRPTISQTVTFGDLFRVLRGLTTPDDVVVLGHGRGRRYRLPTRRCLRRLPCPVVVVVDGHPC